MKHDTQSADPGRKNEGHHADTCPIFGEIFEDVEIEGAQKGLRSRLPAPINERVEAGFVDDGKLLLSTKGVDSIYSLFVVIEDLCQSVTATLVPVLAVNYWTVPG